MGLYPACGLRYPTIESTYSVYGLWYAFSLWACKRLAGYHRGKERDNDTFSKYWCPVLPGSIAQLVIYHEMKREEEGLT